MVHKKRKGRPAGGPDLPTEAEDSKEPITADEGGTAAPASPQKKRVKHSEPHRESLDEGDDNEASQRRAGEDVPDKEEEEEPETFNKVLEKLLFVLAGEDEAGYFLDIKGDGPRQKPVDFRSMQRKIDEEVYRSLQDFQDDFNAICVNAMASHSQTHNVYKTAESLWKFGTRLINSQYERVAKLPVPEESHFQKTTRSMAKKTQEEKGGFRHQKITFAQRAPDGYDYFTSAKLKVTDDLQGGDQVVKINVVPTPTHATPSIPNLGSLLPDNRVTVVSSAPTKPATEVVPDFLDYGTFNSFAPSSDSTRATLSQAEAVGFMKANRKVILEFLQDEGESQHVHIYRGDGSDSELPSSVPDANDVPPCLTEEELAKLQPAESLQLNEVAAAELEAEGVDVEVILALPKQHGDILERNRWEKILKENTELFKQLQDWQDKRYDTGQHLIGEEEKKIGQQLLDNLTQLVATAPASALVSREALEEAIFSLRMYEPAYTGSLPGVKSVAFNFDLSSRTAFPIVSSATPSGTSNDFAGVSMQSAVQSTLPAAPRSSQTAMSYMPASSSYLPPGGPLGYMTPNAAYMTGATNFNPRTPQQQLAVNSYAINPYLSSGVYLPSGMSYAAGGGQPMSMSPYVSTSGTQYGGMTGAAGGAGGGAPGFSTMYAGGMAYAGNMGQFTPFTTQAPPNMASMRNTAPVT
ncbi:hypothetical protein HK104_007668 [Borealophlyctis nickersoniae]|nr:hypothetical protein HK104_007668 [Borealophlyctis nickersoniae]